MIFVDTNVFMVAVGRDHPLRSDARRFFDHALEEASVLATTAEVLQEMLHAYLPVGRTDTLDLALDLVRRATTTVWPLEPDDVRLARGLAETHRGLGARDLLHLACCLRRDVDDLQTYDRALRAAFERRGSRPQRTRDPPTATSTPSRSAPSAPCAPPRDRRSAPSTGTRTTRPAARA